MQNEKLNFLLRPEEDFDRFEAEALTKKAYFNVCAPGCREHYILHALRSGSAFVPELCFVAEYADRLIGVIAYSVSRVVCPEGERNVLTFGPLAVLPEYQGRGAGSALVRQTLSLAAITGFGAVVAYADPDYLRRFGFEAAENFSVSDADGYFCDALLALELKKGALAPGRFLRDSAFDADAKAVLEYDAFFAPMKEGFAPSQERCRKLFERHK